MGAYHVFLPFLIPFPHRTQVCNALTRQRKEEIVADLKEKLQDSVIVFGMRFKGLDVSERSRWDWRGGRRGAVALRAGVFLVCSGGGGA